MDGLHWILAACLGLGLASAIGLNVCLPLLMLAGAAHFHLAGVQLNGHYDWLSSGTSLIVLGVASVLEIIGDKIPVVDHALHAFGMLLRPVAGTLAAASVFTHADPTTAAVAGLIIGAPTAFGFGAATSGVRVASSAATLGCANPFLSVLEDLSSVGMVVLGMLAPLWVPVIVLLAAFALWRFAQAARRKLAPKSAPPIGP